MNLRPQKVQVVFLSYLSLSPTRICIARDERGFWRLVARKRVRSVNCLRFRQRLAPRPRAAISIADVAVNVKRQALPIWRGSTLANMPFCWAQSAQSRQLATVTQSKILKIAPFGVTSEQLEYSL